MSNLDGRITKEIKEALDKEMRESAMDVNVDTRDGFVTISGIVDNLAEKRAAEEIATTIKEIKGIENCITISTDGTITDKHIELEVIKKIQHSRVGDIEGVGVRVNDGIVVLEGSVKTLRDEKLAVNQAEKALGVKDIVSNIKIASYKRFDDASIVNKITQEYSATDLSIPDIFTDVHDGVVRIAGHVDSRKEMELAVEIAQSVEGVIKVENKLKLR